MSDLIVPGKSLGYSDIYLDFLKAQNSARHFFPAAGIEDVAVGLDAVSYDREEIAAVLERQNRAFGVSNETFANIEKLKDKKALCAFTSQQACLFGGPLLIIIKALAIVKAARRYSEQLNRPVVPVFWIAGDDHDFEEVNHTCVLDRQGETVRISYKTPPAVELPTAEIRFSDEAELEKAKGALKTALGDTDFTPELYDLIDSSYTPDSTFVTAFGKLMARLTGQFGLILFSPGDPAVKRLAAPFFTEILNKQDELHHVITTTNRLIERHGYHLQVQKKDNATHMFWNLDGRKPVTREGGNFLVGDRRYTEKELRQCIDESPDRASPDVMLRPVLQSYLFPVLTQKGGPSEIAYLAQINPIFALFGLVGPYYMARPSLTFIEKRFEKLMAEHEIAFEELTGDIEQVVNRVLVKSFPENLESKFERLRHDVERRFGEFIEESLAFDPALRQFGTQMHGKIDFTLKQFEGKVFASHKRKSKEARDRIYRLWHAVYPNHALQERTLNVAYFLSRYGLGFISFMYDKIDCEEKAHQIVHLKEFQA